MGRSLLLISLVLLSSCLNKKTSSSKSEFGTTPVETEIHSGVFETLTLKEAEKKADWTVCQNRNDPRRNKNWWMKTCIEATWAKLNSVKYKSEKCELAEEILSFNLCKENPTSECKSADKIDDFCKASADTVAENVHSVDCQRANQVLGWGRCDDSDRPKWLENECLAAESIETACLGKQQVDEIDCKEVSSILSWKRCSEADLPKWLQEKCDFALPLAKHCELYQEEEIAKGNDSSSVPFPVVDVADPQPSIEVGPTKAFPTAEGFGRKTTGGRGGSIIFVTNRNSDGVGSFKKALETSGKRIIVFKVGGTIDLKGQKVVAKPDVTIFGQTAPGKDGIMIFGGNLVFSDNTIVRGLRVRAGDNPPWIKPDSWDAVSIKGSNVIFDHCSIGWGTDGSLDMYTSDPNKRLKNITIQWTIVSETFHCTGHSNGTCHSLATLVGDYTENITFHHNLYAYSQQRAPLFKGDARNYEVINHVGPKMDSGWEGSAKPILLSFAMTKEARENSKKLGNLMHHGHVINNWVDHILVGKNAADNDGFPKDTKVYMAGNKFHQGLSTWKKHNGGYQNFQTTNSPVFTPSGVTVHSAEEGRDLVLAKAGAYFPRRDQADLRAVSGKGLENYKISGVKNKNLLDSMNEVGGKPNFESSTSYPVDSDSDGIPDSFELKLGLNKAVKDSHKLNSQGYMQIEVYANSLLNR